MAMTRQEKMSAKRAKWKKRIAQWEASGLTQAVYCREKGLSIHRFSYWRKKWKAASPVSFAEVSMPVELCGYGRKDALVVRVRDRFAVEVPEGFSPDLLGRLIQTLEAI